MGWQSTFDKSQIHEPCDCYLLHYVSNYRFKLLECAQIINRRKKEGALLRGNEISSLVFGRHILVFSS